jgi:hypothetical protein
MTANGYGSNWICASIGLCVASARAGEGLARGDGEALGEGDGDATSPGLGEGTAEAAAAAGLAMGLVTASCADGGGDDVAGGLAWQAVTSVSRAVATSETSQPPERQLSFGRLRNTRTKIGKWFGSATSVPFRTL